MQDRTSHARGWFRKADSDLASARRLISDELFDTACFHAQQAAEKYLKGLLAFHGGPIPLIHDLSELERVCVAVEPRLVLPAPPLAEITPYAVELRYDFDFWPDETVAGEAVAVAEQVRAAILTLVPSGAHP